MATTTNYGWTTPDDTALVKDGASAIRSLGSSIDTTTKNLNPSTTLGDIEYRSATANTNTRLPIGSTGQVLTVNAGVPAWVTPTFSGCSVFHSTTQSTSNSVWTTLSFDSEHFDTDAYHSTSSNTSRFTIPTGKSGKFLLTLAMEFDQNTSGTRWGGAIVKNGTVLIYGSNTPAISDSGARRQVSFITSAVAGDYFEFQVRQTSGGSLNVTGGSQQNTASIVFLGA